MRRASPVEQVRDRRRHRVGDRAGGDRAAGARAAAARPCTRAASGAGVERVRPAASRVPAIPARTSPAPAVASQPGRRPGCAAGRPGSATSVVEPLSRTVAPVSAAARHDVRGRPASTSSRGGAGPRAAPSSRASSPACGVSSTCGRRRRAARRGTRPSAPASTTHGTPAARAARRRPAGRRRALGGRRRGPTTQACTRPVARRPPRGGCSRTCSAGVLRPDVADHPGPGPQRAGDGEHGGPG